MNHIFLCILGRLKSQAAKNCALITIDRTGIVPHLKTLTDQLEREKERALSDRSSELKKEFDSKIAALHRANEDAMGKLRAEH